MDLFPSKEYTAESELGGGASTQVSVDHFIRVSATGSDNCHSAPRQCVRLGAQNQKYFTLDQKASGLGP